MRSRKLKTGLIAILFIFPSLHYAAKDINNPEEDFHAAVSVREIDKAISELIRFMNAHPDHKRVEEAEFRIGELYYLKKNYSASQRYLLPLIEGRKEMQNESGEISRKARALLGYIILKEFPVDRVCRGKDVWYIRVGVFGVKANAEKLTQGLRNDGYATINKEKDNLNLVWAGIYLNHSTAVKVSKYIAKKYGVVPVVRKVKTNSSLKKP